jgi:hypothetical protein
MRSACFWKISDGMELLHQSKLLDDNRMANFRTANSTVLRVRDRQVQGRDRLGTLQSLSIGYVLGRNKRHVDSDMLVLSGELDVAARERVEGLLPVQRRLPARRRGVRRVPAGDVQPAVGAARVLQLHDRHVLAEHLGDQQRDVLEL